MDRNFSYRRGSSPMSKRRERLQKQKKLQEGTSPVSSDQEKYGKEVEQEHKTKFAATSQPILTGQPQPHWHMQ